MLFCFEWKDSVVKRLFACVGLAAVLGFTPVVPAWAGEGEFIAALMAEGFLNNELSGVDYGDIYGMGDRICEGGLGRDMMLPMIMGLGGGGMSMERAMLFMTLAQQSYC